MQNRNVILRYDDDDDNDNYDDGQIVCHHNPIVE